MPSVLVNNTPTSIQDECNLQQLITIAGYQNQRIAIALNGEFIPKTQYNDTQLNHNDAIDIVKPIGGG